MESNGSVTVEAVRGASGDKPTYPPVRRSYTHKLMAEKALAFFRLALAALGCFMLVWSSWYLQYGSTFPAGRKYFLLQTNRYPSLSYLDALQAHRYMVAALGGGFPTVNDALRLAAGGLVVVTELLWVLLLYGHRWGPWVFWVGEFGVLGLAVAAAVLDFRTVINAYRVCHRSSASARCGSSPAYIGPFPVSDLQCDCTSEAYYWATAAIDTTTALAAIGALILGPVALTSLRRHNREVERKQRRFVGL
ncbi:hypothetical protein CDCA_CDCA09G2809 [Cyanidium caldarium]|uniref:Uncharacterized protein n=1 Tax=Cyanidium caldarium TaxID=2771 RepID=A0AAV9IWX2_CYACA|nr:hypothetical protein CDCA_CDCA09G2809 [Cyanidium caldarium]